MSDETPMHSEAVFVVGENYVSLCDPEEEKTLVIYPPEYKQQIIWLVRSAATFHKKSVRYELDE